jgi:hypothetical protein
MRWSIAFITTETQNNLKNKGYDGQMLVSLSVMKPSSRSSRF